MLSIAVCVICICCAQWGYPQSIPPSFNSCKSDNTGLAIITDPISDSSSFLVAIPPVWFEISSSEILKGFPYPFSKISCFLIFSGILFICSGWIGTRLSSSFFEDYVSEIFGEKCTKEFYITQEQIQEHCWNTGLIWQLYEGSDIFDWHVDGYSNGVSLWSFTYYLWWYEGEWKEEYGWILELWEWKWGDISTYEKIVPKKNRIVFILYSDTAFHRVTSNKSHLPRLSLQSTIIKVL